MDLSTSPAGQPKILSPAGEIAESGCAPAFEIPERNLLVVVRVLQSGGSGGLPVAWMLTPDDGGRDGAELSQAEALRILSAANRSRR
jgi:hypothetical protein